MKSRKTMVNVLKAIFQCTPAAALVCVLCSLVYSLCATCSTTFLARMLETAQILSPSILPEMLLFAACYLLIQIIRKIFNLIQDISWNVGVEEMCKYRFQMELSEKIGVLPYINFEDEQIHDRIVRARNSVDSMALTQAYTNFLAVAESFITVLGLVAAMMSYNGWYLPIMALSVIPFFISRLKAGKEFYQLQWFQASHVRKRNYFYSLFTTSAFQKEQRIFGFGDYFKQRWNKERRLVEDETVAFRNTDSRHLAWCETWITAGYVCSILLSAILVAQGKICLGVFGAGIYAFRTAQDCTRCFFALYGFLNENLLEASNFFDFLNFDEEPKGDRSFSHLQQGIAVTNVKFTYPNTNTPALNIQQLRIQAGERVVIVGENGSGKSTLVKLLTGLYVPQEGQIQYDGIDLRSISREDLSKLIGAVSQEFVSYHLSIRDNMGMRNPELVEDDNRIHTALVQAGLKLSSDYDQWLGREFGGTELSGGQWQRLAIASVLGKECQVIFLDEPTSALDPNAEYEILKHFMQLSDNKTAVIISHRVGLCRLADKVVYLKQGQVEGVGSHQRLMDTCEAYRDFYFEQAKWHIA